MPTFHPPAISPEYYGQFPVSSSGTMQQSHASYYGPYNQDLTYPVSTQESFNYAKQAQLPMSAHMGMSGSFLLDQARSRTNAYSGLDMHDQTYGSAALLPPLRSMSDRMESIESKTHKAVQPPKQKEEQITGGVTAHLDYEMEKMVEFVAEMAKGIVPLSVVPTRLSEFVSHILTSTRLPSSTILLSLHYLATRMTMISSQGYYAFSNDDLKQFLISALMLASKFLDDNTFQNRSWAEVSKIPVGQLNKNELEWLAAIGWDLHIDPNDSQGLAGWIKKWQSWQRQHSGIPDSLKITPLDVNVLNQPQISKLLPPIYTPSYAKSMYGMDGSQLGWQQWSAPQTASPPSPPSSGPTTPEWYLPSDMGYGQGHFGYQPRAVIPSHQALPSSTSSFYNHYTQQYTPTSNWSGHASNCYCGYCQPRNDRYPMIPTY